MTTLEKNLNCNSTRTTIAISGSTSNSLRRKDQLKMLGILRRLSALFSQDGRPATKNEAGLHEQMAWLHEMEDFDRF